MPREMKIQKEDVLNAAYEIVRTLGMERINARAIAQKLKSSVHPIFHHFKNMEDLKKELYEKILNTYHKYISQGMDKEKPYKELGKNYIKFAEQEPKLFQIIFMSQTNLQPETFVNYDASFSNAEQIAGEATNLNNDDAKKFHIKMWIFTHGIATLIATNTCKFTEEEINSLLTEEFMALSALK